MPEARFAVGQVELPGAAERVVEAEATHLLEAGQEPLAPSPQRGRVGVADFPGRQHPPPPPRGVAGEGWPISLADAPRSREPRSSAAAIARSDGIRPPGKMYLCTH